jgi:DNA-binding transcriptional MocR family regulator
MLTAMEREFPDGVTWTYPAGGLFLWVTLPDDLDATELLKDALEQKVAYVPGTSFFPDGSGRNTLRMNFSFCKPETINVGIKRLGEVFSRAIERREIMATNGVEPIGHVAF